MKTEADACRNRYYEFFKATHILAAVVFVVFFFFHCDFRLTSWYIQTPPFLVVPC